MTKTVIVEDDPMVAEINRRYLEQIDGIELVAIAGSVEEALPILKENQVDLILLDIHMPGDNGWSLLSKIRGLGTEIDVIIITASCDKESIKKGLRFGAVDYLIKPFEFERFQSALLSYKKDQMMMNEQERINQMELDLLLLHKEQITPEGYDLPKGLTKSTLCKVWRQVLEMGRTPFSTEELACKVGISRVSMRKYVMFLADIHALETEVVYGTIGRPVYMHKAAIVGSNIIDHYINH
ncbi:response regulator [Neobacillus cucumis]|uniref:Two-component system response regulator DcuR n=1 Tax=Neobacillus cucumis TaxID=1740721 RepID=A0A2N5HD39_9BACI|nr:response regulator [Neobacillus cucumis]PLS03423.1 two-component system response regulator DcuR [Neobacillus cucumis]